MVPKKRTHIEHTWGYFGSIALSYNVKKLSARSVQPVELSGVSRVKLSSRVAEDIMDWDRIRINWKVHGVSAAQTWTKLSEPDLEIIGGDRDKLVVYLADLYGYGKDRAEAEVELWRRALCDSATLVSSDGDDESNTRENDHLA